MTPAKFLLRVVAGACFGAVLPLVLVKLLPFDSRWVIPVFVIVTLCGGYSPFFTLNRAIEKRKGAIQKALPEFLDMVATTVQAGLALNSALAYAVEAAPGPLGEEIKEALSEIRLGRSRADALRAVGDRTNQPDLRNALRDHDASRAAGREHREHSHRPSRGRAPSALDARRRDGREATGEDGLPDGLLHDPGDLHDYLRHVAANYFAPKP